MLRRRRAQPKDEYEQPEILREGDSELIDAWYKSLDEKRYPFDPSSLAAINQALHSHKIDPSIISKVWK